MSWENRNFKELGFIGRGKSRHRPRNDESLYGGDYPMIQTGDVKAANFYLNSFSQTYNEKGLSQSKLWEPNTLCITIAANIAETAILGMKACFPDSIIGFIADDKKSDVRFIKYFFDIYKERMQRISQGTTQDNLSLEKLLTFEVPTPPLQTQKRIADILSSYDDLIENNLKRIKLLEQAAQNIYKEWFVNLRFPGHENTPINEETGLPEGWREKTLGEFTEINKGKNITKSTIIAGNVPVVAGGLKPAYYHNTSNTINPVITVSASGANAGYVNIYLEDIWASDCSYIDSNLSDSVFFIHNLLLNHQELIFGMQRGAAQPHVYPKDLKRAEFVIPDKVLIQKFEEQVSAQYDMKRVLLNQNQKLKAARDILLPRLMNRTIEV
ncbi:restriction endonuclease subunit S [Flavobacteriaceae bacterium]|nr:restriction endonuclease subunit S [Flavobacteriaceae bacterium]